MSLNTLLVPIALFLVIGNSPVGSAPGNPRPGKLKLTILDSDSGQPTPARVELQDSKGQGYVAEDALPAGGDCSGTSKLRAARCRHQILPKPGRHSPTTEYNNRIRQEVTRRCNKLQRKAPTNVE